MCQMSWLIKYMFLFYIFIKSASIFQKSAEIFTMNDENLYILLSQLMVNVENGNGAVNITN
jgi:hypothetical protein